jgi:multidrug efflux pump subunit AcrA (membrane-fusion protein)
VGLFLLALTAWACGEISNPKHQSPDLHLVTRGDLRITVREQAEVQAAVQTSVKSELEGRANTLIYLIPEGTVVAKGDKLAELDVSEIEEKRANQAIAVAKAGAGLEQLIKTVEIMEKELEAGRTTAESTLTIAEMELEKFRGRVVENPPTNGVPFEEGTNREMLRKLTEMLETAALEDSTAGAATEVRYAGLSDTVRELLDGGANLDRDMGQMANQILEQIDQIRLARAELVLKADTLHHSEVLADNDFITQNELEKDRLTYDSQFSKVTLAWNGIDLLINYNLRQQKIQLNQDVVNAELDLERIMAGNDARRVKERADLESSQLEFALATERLENWDMQIANAVMLAPNPGLVVYAKQGRGMSQQPVEEGMEVRKRQTLIVLPDVTNMRAELKVHEADIDKVAATQEATVEVDAFPERIFHGKVDWVAALPDSGSRFTNNDLKVYKAFVSIDGDNEGQVLRPGMNATVEIMIGVVKNVINVPLPAVHSAETVHYVWKRTLLGPEATRVSVGRNNLTNVEIETGLEEGETIYLSVPPGAEIPKFDLPKDPGGETVLGDAAEARATAERRRRERERNQAMASDSTLLAATLRPFLTEKLPHRAEALAQDASFFRLLADDEFLDEMEEALKSDAALQEQWQAFREAAQNRGPATGRGGPGARGGDRGPGRGGPRGRGRRGGGQRGEDQREDNPRRSGDEG